MDAEEIMGLMALIALVIIPALALTARFAMKPIVESIVQLRKAFNENKEPITVDPAQLALLERELADLRRDVEQLKNVREFEHALQPGAARQLEQPKG
jgi:sirohydrochlorin ferrochelatase